MAAPIYIPTNTAQGSPFSITLPKLAIFCLFDNSHSNRDEVILTVILIFISLMISDIEASFHVLVVHLYVFFGKKSLISPLTI